MEDLICYSKTGNKDGLYDVIKQHPQVLKDLDKIQFVETPLHAAAASGATDFAIEIMNLMPSFGKKLNPEGLSPLHLALKTKQRETAQALVRFDKQLVRVKGKNGSTPLHQAVANCTKLGDDGEEEEKDLNVLASLLLECPDSIYDLNNRFQSAVHLVMETNNCSAVTLVLNWLVRMAKEPVLGLKDADGNTPLHIAARHHCPRGMKLMVQMAKLNKRNSDGKTPLDIARVYKFKDMENILDKASARSGVQLRKKESPSKYLRSNTNCLENLLRGFCFMLKDLTLEMRNVVLVVAALIAIATYQAVLQPPGGVFQDEGADNQTTTTRRSRIPATGWRALEMAVEQLVEESKRKRLGKMVMSNEYYKQFIPTNTMAFTLSMVMIIYILHGRPYNVIIHGCLLFLAYSYLVALDAISKPTSVLDTTYILSWGTIALAFATKMAYYLLKALFEEVWWLPRWSVRMSNLSNRLNCTPAFKVTSFIRRIRRQCKLILGTGKYL